MDSDPDSSRTLLHDNSNQQYKGSSNNNMAGGQVQHMPDTFTHANSKAAYAASQNALLTSPCDLTRLHRRVARLTSYLYGLAVVVVVGGIILIAIIASLYAKLYYDLTHHSHQPKVGEQVAKILEREELCVPCSEVRLGPSPDEEAMLSDFTRRDTKDGQNCCVERPAELLRLLELVSKQTLILKKTHTHK